MATNAAALINHPFLRRKAGGRRPLREEIGNRVFAIYDSYQELIRLFPEYEMRQEDRQAVQVYTTLALVRGFDAKHSEEVIFAGSVEMMVNDLHQERLVDLKYAGVGMDDLKAMALELENQTRNRIASFMLSRSIVFLRDDDGAGAVNAIREYRMRLDQFLEDWGNQ